MRHRRDTPHISYECYTIRHLKTLGYINRYDLGASQFDGKKFNELHFHLRFFAQIQRK